MIHHWCAMANEVRGLKRKKSPTEGIYYASMKEPPTGQTGQPASERINTRSARALSSSRQKLCLQPDGDLTASGKSGSFIKAVGEERFLTRPPLVSSTRVPTSRQRPDESCKAGTDVRGAKLRNIAVRVAKAADSGAQLASCKKSNVQDRSRSIQWLKLRDHVRTACSRKVTPSPPWPRPAIFSSANPALFAGRLPAATITSTGSPCQAKSAASMIVSDRSGRIHSGSGLEATSHPQTNSRHGCCGRSS